MEKNYAVWFKAPNTVEYTELPIVKPKDGEILMKSHRSLISNGTETSILSSESKGSFWEGYKVHFPFTPGYSSVSTIIEAGKGVDKSWVGKKVACHSCHSSYNTRDIISARPNLIRDGVSDDNAVFSILSKISLQGVRRARLKLGESVVVYGLGPIGNMALQFARLSGATPIIAVDTSDFRLSFVPDAPDIIKVNPLKQNVKEVVEKATKGRMADVVFEVTGVASLIPKEFEALHNQGRFIVLSSPRGKTEIDFHDLCNRPSFEIIGAHQESQPAFETLDNPWTHERNIELFLDLVAAGKIDAAKLISHRAKYTEAGKIYEMLLKNPSGALGVVFEW